MTNHVELIIEEILRKKPGEIRQIYEQDQKLLASGTPQEKRTVAQRHALHFLQLDDAIDRATLTALQREAKEGKIDQLTLADANDASPSFERIRKEPDGKMLWKRGMTVEGFKVIGNHIITTVYGIFEDDARRKCAAHAQEFTSTLTEHARTHADNIELVNALERFKPIAPVYSAKNILVNLFIDGQNMHEIFRNADTDEKYKHLADLTRIDVALHYYAKAKKNAFQAVDHSDRLIAKGVARNYPAYAEHLRQNPVFASILADLQGTQSFVHGDALPPNVMISWRDSPERPEPLYHPIDFEEACLDFVEAPLVQKLIKSGVYNERGESVRFRQSTLEEEALKILQDQAKKLDTNFDSVASTKRFLALKAEQCLIWASRYRAAAEVATNRSELLMLSKYYYTLFCREAVQQGRVKDTHNLDDLNSLFQPLTYEQMLSVHQSLQPQSRSVSAFKVDIVGNVDAKLEEMMHDYNRRKRWQIGGRIAAGITLVGALIGEFFVHEEYTKTQKKLHKAELNGKYEAKVRIIRLSQSSGAAYSNEELMGLDELKMWKKRFKEDEFAYAAFIDYAELYKAMQSVNPASDDYKRDLLFKLPDDLRIVLLDTQYTVDNWMYNPQLNGLFPEKPGMPYETGRERHAYERIEQTIKAAEEAYEAEQRQKAQKPIRYSPLLGDLDDVKKNLQGFK